MNAFDRGFEKRLRNQVRAAIAASPPLKAEARRVKKGRRQEAPAWVRRLGLSFLAAVVVGGVCGGAQSVEAGLVPLMLWATGTAFHLARVLHARLYFSEELVVWHHFPLEDDDVFSLQWRGFLRDSVWMVADYVAAYLAIEIVGAGLKDSAIGLDAVLRSLSFGVLQAWIVLMLSIHILARFRAPLALLATAFRGGALATFFGVKHLGHLLPQLVGLAYWIAPAGWVNYLYFKGAREQDFTALWLVPPLALIVWGVTYSFAHVRAGFSMPELREAQPGRDSEQNADPDFDGEALPRRESKPGATEVEESILRGAFLAPFDWAGAGWFERAMAKLFNERERAAAEFLVGGNPKWSRQYKSACLVCLFLLTFVAMFGGYDRFMVFFPAYILLNACVPLIDDKWPGLVPLPTGGVFAPLYSVYPVGYDDIARVLLKVNLFRCLLALPLLALFGGLGGWKVAGYSPLDGVLLAVKTAAMAAALQPVVVVIRVSSATNDTKRAQLKWALILAPTTLAMIAIGYACFTSSSFGIVAGSVLLNAFFAAIILLWQRRAYNRNKIDLLSKQAPGT